MNEELQKILELQQHNRQIRLSERMDILMKQSIKLMDIIKENQKQVNDLKAKQDKLKGGE